MNKKMKIFITNDEMFQSYIIVAKASKRLYDHTKGRKGLCKILNKFAMRINRWARNKGRKIISNNVNLITEMIEELKEIAQ